MEKKAKKIGLIGCGRWGKHVLRDLLYLGAEVHVVAPSEATRDFALQQGAKASYADLADIGQADGYVVVAPTSMHAPIVERLLPTGKPVFVEKPLCINPDDARRIANEARDRIFVMDKWRYHPGIRKIAELVSRSELGEILSGRINRVGWGHAHKDMDSLLMLLPHDFSILLHVLGDIPPLRSAFKTTEAPDGGMIAVLGGSGSGPLMILETSIMTPEHRRTFTFVGKRATVQLTDSYESKVLLRRGPPGALSAETENVPADGPLPLLRELEVFLEHLDGGPPPVSSADDGRLIVERIAEIRGMLGLCG